MTIVRNLVAAIAAGSALSLGAAAFAQDAKKPEQPKAEAKQHQHRGMDGMRGMGGCHGEGHTQGGHNHS